jgi:hypothetical protein
MRSGAINEPALIVRRNFLIRALGFTAAGAALPIPLIVAETAEARIAYHLQEACRALRELHPAASFHPAFRRPAPWEIITAGDIVAVIKAATPPP